MAIHGGSDPVEVDAAAGTASLRTLGTAATAACAGNDARLAVFSGTCTLSTGTKATTITGVTSSMYAQVSVITAGGTMGTTLLCVCTTDTLTVTSQIAAGTTAAGDTSTLYYRIYSA
jgi:hypothetical protein